MFENRFNDQIALVTGGASGIGKAVAQRLAKEGAHVVLADINQDALIQVNNELGHDKASSLLLDVSRENDVKVGIETIVKEHGQRDIVFHSAGIAGHTGTPITDYDSATHDDVFTVNQLRRCLDL